MVVVSKKVIMKNKKMLYILIPATLVVWGLIIYKIMSGLDKDENKAAKPQLSAAVTNETVSDTFSINPTYRDPFLGKTIKPVTVSTSPVKQVAVPVVRPQLQWPAIVYSGTIANKNLKKEMVLIQINGQEYMMRQGEKVNDVELFKIYKDSIEVHFSKEKKIIHK
jgi:hypothetical protein